MWDTLKDILEWVPKHGWEWLLDTLAWLLEQIPVPSWLADADPFASLDPGVVYFAEAFEIPVGIAILIGAYVLRFVIRRIPLFG